MITLEDFEGVTGFRWGIHIDRQGQNLLRGRVPEQATRKIAVIARILQQGPLHFVASDLHFDGGKVLVRRGSYGLLMLFVEDRTNTSIIDALLIDTSSGADNGRSQTTTGSRMLDSHTNLGTVHSISLDANPVPAEILEELLDIYTEFLGPLARSLARKQARQEQIDLADLTTRQWSKLLNALAARISDEEKHEAFLDRAVLLKTRF